MPVKQVIVVRKELNMRKGKMCAQVAHASLMSFLSNGFSTTSHKERQFHFHFQKNSDWMTWLDEGQTKVVVSCETREDLMDILGQANEAGLPTAAVRDAGRTEFNGEPTDTCIAIGPANSEEIDKITGHLKLL